jgi:WD40 repeat protein
VSPDGRLIAVATDDLDLIDAATGATIARLDGHRGRVLAAHWTRAGDLLTAGADGTVRRWSSTGTLQTTYQAPGGRHMAAVGESPDGALVVGGGGDGMLRWWEAATGRQLWSIQVSHGAIVWIRIQDGDVLVQGAGGDVSRWRIPSADKITIP